MKTGLLVRDYIEDSVWCWRMSFDINISDEWFKRVDDDIWEREKVYNSNINERIVDYLMRNGGFS